jgi:hypothetical protein
LPERAINWHDETSVRASLDIFAILISLGVKENVMRTTIIVIIALAALLVACQDKPMDPLKPKVDVVQLVH